MRGVFDDRDEHGHGEFGDAFDDRKKCRRVLDAETAHERRPLRDLVAV